MDNRIINQLVTGRGDQAWVETMVNLEARALLNQANKLAVFQLSDGLTRIEFLQEIKKVIEQQFAIARRAKTDAECITCVKNLRDERASLEEQERLLKMQVAKLYAQVEFVKENNKIVGYVITAVKVVIAGAAAIGGAIMIARMAPIGALAGAILVTDGFNELSKEFIHYKYGKEQKTEGIIATL